MISSWSSTTCRDRDGDTLTATNAAGSSVKTVQVTVPAMPPTTPIGTPHNGPHQIPGILQAEDYDLGGEGVAYHDTTRENKGGVYRRTMSTSNSSRPTGQRLAGLPDRFGAGGPADRAAPLKFTFPTDFANINWISFVNRNCTPAPTTGSG